MVRHMRTLLLCSLASCLVFVLGGTAHARGAHFIGGHPVAAKFGGGFCYIDAPHIHAYPPDRAQLYQRVGEDFVFAADPTPFGYEGDKHPFYGNHPVVTVNGEPVICYIDGPHFHPFDAPSGPEYKREKGVAFYIGAFPPAYAQLRPQRSKHVNAEYRPFVALRPTIEVAPPPEWQGEVWVAPPAIEVRGPSVAVSAPGVIVDSPSVAVSAPGFVAVGPRVYVQSPGVVVGGGVYVEEGHGRGKHREHHDNGRHNGWYKH